ncbi:MAG: hypothetical protein KIT33_00330 [Candidatus Kapabacteria bacterium]|nr:hypothetical protein [Ignavibacteriota bacterium]MCW5883394.1 hypothetical protein [Candidatus Kapabacteria bacterium]
MSIVTDDHFLGIYKFENVSDLSSATTTMAQYYRNKRRHFLDILNQVKTEYRLQLIDIEFKEVKNQLSPETFKKLNNNKLFDEIPVHHKIHEDENLLLASYILFLSILQKQYKKIAELNFIDVKWLKDYATFQSLYNILTKYNIISSDYYRFQSFFLLKNEMIFNTNLYETSSIFYHLIKYNYISETTLNTMLNNSLIIAKKGNKANTIEVLTTKSYKKNETKITSEYDSTKIRKDVKDAMNEFGISLPPKK